jgi:hypothetical protein
MGTIPLIFIGGWISYGIYEAANLGMPVAFMKFSREFEAQADYLGVQYMYKAGYGPQSFTCFFELESLEKRKPGPISKPLKIIPHAGSHRSRPAGDRAHSAGARRVRGGYLRISGCQGAAASYRKQAQA